MAIVGEGQSVCVCVTLYRTQRTVSTPVSSVSVTLNCILLVQEKKDHFRLYCERDRAMNIVNGNSA